MKHTKYSFHQRASNIGVCGVCVLTILLFHPVLGLSSPIVANNDSTSQQWALLIGIGHYSQLSPLKGPVNDVEIISYALHTRYGFKKDHILTLQNEAATRSGIMNSFKELKKNIRPTDVLYIHYSGHGSQIKDFNGDEIDDHKDETIVPYDGRTENVPDITDDELHEQLSQIRAQRMIISIDACHSGSATRSPNIRTRSIPPDTRLDLYQPNQRYTRGSRTFGPPHAVVFSSSAPHEQALDGRIGGRYHGYFSYAIFRSFLDSSPEATPRMIFASVKNKLHTVKNLLHRKTFPAPQLEASQSLLHEPLFPISGQPQLSSSAWISPTNPRGQVLAKPISAQFIELEPARYFGGLPGSVWEIRPTSQDRNTHLKQKALATVVEMKRMNSVAKIAGGERIRWKPAYAKLVQPATPPNRLSIIVRDFFTALSNQSRKIQDILRPHQEVRKTNTLDGFIVDVHEHQVDIRSADGAETITSLSTVESDNLTSQFNAFLEHSLQPLQLSVLQNPNSSVVIKARLLNTVPIDQTNESIISDPTLFVHQPNEPSNPKNSLQLELRVNQPSFLTILNADADGKIRTLFPSPYQNPSFYPNGLIPGNTNVALPDSFTESNQAGFVWDIGHPTGRDTLYIFASTDLEVAKQVRSIGLRARHIHDQQTTRGDSDRHCSMIENLRAVLYHEIRQLKNDEGCNHSSYNTSSYISPSRGQQNFEVIPKTGLGTVKKDWNSLSLQFWVEEPR